MPVSLLTMREILLPGLREVVATFHPSSMGFFGSGVLGSTQTVTAASTAGLQAVQNALQQAQMQINAQQAQDYAQLHQQYTTVTSTGGVGPQTIVYGQSLSGVDVAAAQLAANPFFRHSPTTENSSYNEATSRSLELLHDWLTPQQRKQLISRDCFEVIGGDTGTHYWIVRPVSPYNIHQYSSNGICEVKLCFIPEDRSLPLGDIWLTQKLALELDEKNTLEIANRSPQYLTY